MTEPDRRGPVLIEGDDPALAGPEPSPADAPPPDGEAAGDAAAAALHLAARPRRLSAGLLLLASLAAFVLLALGVSAWSWTAGLLARTPALGAVAAALGALAALAALTLLAREALALRRLARIDSVRSAAEAARRDADRPAAARALDRLAALYAPRDDLAWPTARVAERREEMVDAEALLTLAEREWLTPLDKAARRAAEEAARSVAGATALAPFPLVDIAAVLLINLRMIRRIAQIYGGRAGALGAWRLLRAVAGHLIATGAVAAADDFLGPALGAGVLSRVSRRLGEGLVNGALTARIGVAAIEVCRPLPFSALPAPRARRLAARALGDLTGIGREG
ncbi:MAG: TIGR01620 family protein [Pseudomonadota bacterium]